MAKIIFRADGNKQTGLGHMYRIFAIIEMAIDTYDYVLLVNSSSNINVIPSHYNYQVIPDDITLNLEPEWIGKAFADYSTVVADGYQFSLDWQEGIKNWNKYLVYIDDLVIKSHADVIVNHSPHVNAASFHPEPNQRMALGTKYSMIRPEFLEAAKNKRTVEKIDTAFICFGGADPNNLTVTALAGAIDSGVFQEIHVVVGLAYEFSRIEKFAKKEGIHIHRGVSSDEMLKILQNSNFAIVPASTILYEVCSVKMLVLCGYFVDNQINVYNGFKASNAVIGVEDFRKLDEQNFCDLIQEAAESKEIQQFLDNQQVLVDGSIKKRFLPLLQKITLREVEDGDSDLLFELANEPSTRANSFNSNPIEISDHKRWFSSKLHDKNSLNFVVELDTKPAGVVRFDVKEDHTIIGINISEKFRGKGLANEALIRSSSEYFNRFSMPILAYIKVENKPSIKAFENAGFKFHTEEEVNGFDSKVFKLDHNDFQSR